MTTDMYRLPKKYKPKYYTANGLTLSNGNTKIGPDTMVLNLTSATDCPSRRLGLCQLDNPADCYALKAERHYYTTVLPYRRRQAAYWANNTKALINHQSSRVELMSAPHGTMETTTNDTI